MRTVFGVLLAVGTFMAPTVSFAGWGAIACDSRGSGACSVAYGQRNQGSAEAIAMRLCSNRGYRCYINRWERNSCVYGPNGSWACN